MHAAGRIFLVLAALVALYWVGRAIAGISRSFASDAASRVIGAIVVAALVVALIVYLRGHPLHMRLH